MNIVCGYIKLDKEKYSVLQREAFHAPLYDIKYHKSNANYKNKKFNQNINNLFVAVSFNNIFK